MSPLGPPGEEEMDAVWSTEAGWPGSKSHKKHMLHIHGMSLDLLHRLVYGQFLWCSCASINRNVPRLRKATHTHTLRQKYYEFGSAIKTVPTHHFAHVCACVCARACMHARVCVCVHVCVLSCWCTAGSATCEPRAAVYFTQGKTKLILPSA